MELSDNFSAVVKETLETEFRLFICYLLLVVGHICIVWLLPYFPTQDGPSHIYNLVILHDLINGGKDWGEYFTYNLRAVPNLGFHLVAYPLILYFSPQTIERIYVSICILLMSTSVPVFLLAYGKRAFPLSFLVFPVVFNYTLMMGFYSFTIAVPVFLFAVSISWKIRNRSKIYKFIVLNAVGTALFYIHLIPFCLFLMSLITIPFCCRDNISNKLKNTAITVILIMPILYVLGSYLYTDSNPGSVDSSAFFSVSNLYELICELPLFSIDTFSKWQMIPWSILIIIYIQLIRIAMIKKPETQETEEAGRHALVMTCCIAVIYLVSPFTFASGTIFSQRLPWVIFLMSMPCLGVPETGFLRRFRTFIFAGLASAFLICNVFVFVQQSHKVSMFLRGLSYGLPKSSYIMIYKSKGPGWSRVDVLLHAISYYGMTKKCIDVGNYETAHGYFPVHFLKGLPSFPLAQQIDYSPTTIDFLKYPFISYLLCWDISTIDEKRLSAYFHNVWQKEQMGIWRRKATTTD